MRTKITPNKDIFHAVDFISLAFKLAIIMKQTNTAQIIFQLRHCNELSRISIE